MRADEAPPTDCDLLVIGSGCGAFSAAVSAAQLGLDVVLVEKEPHFGGTTAWSGGWMFVPRNPLARAAGIDEDVAEVRRYLQAVCGAQFRAERVDAFLAHAPAAVRFHLDRTALKFVDGNAIPDFHGRLPGAREGGRSVCAAPFDGRALGKHLARLRPPCALWSFLGISIGGDLRHFLRAGRAADSFAYVARRVLRQAWDVLRHGRGTLRMGGNALAAALFKSALDAGVRCFESHAALALLRDGSREDGEGRRASARVVGARVRRPDGTLHEIVARRGVVLACGGFPHDDARRAALFPHAPGGREHWSAAPAANTGDGLRLGESAGGVVDRSGADAGAWCPVSLVPLAGEGEVQAFPHLIERGKPGLIAVTRDGMRFVDEAGDYHSLMRALFARGEREAWLICDHRFQRRFGLGHAKPFPLPIGRALRSGYLKRGDTVEALAGTCGIDAAGLSRTIATYNAHAGLGRDPAFGRGETAYERMQGDAEHAGPNPCVAPIERAPFYAVRVLPGSLGTFAGLEVDVHSRVLDARGAPIEGLYAAGNDASSVMGGHYPSGGITLGPALVFGHVLAHHAAGRALPMPTLDEPGSGAGRLKDMKRAYSLAQLTALTYAPPQMLRLAAASGCGACGIRLLPASPGGVCHAMAPGSALLAETLAAMRATGVRVLDLEIIRIAPVFDARAFEAFFEVGAALGARHVLVAGDDADAARTTAHFAALCDAAAPFGLSCDLEPMPWCPVASVSDAARIVEGADRPNGAVLIDALHFFRSASTLDDLARLQRTRLNYAQICDGHVPGPTTVEGLIHDARCERLLPGEGGFPLQTLFAALPADLPVSIEIPSHTRVHRMGHEAWAHAAVAAARRVLEAGGAV